jgi:soluble P-type ATPase
LAQLREYVSPDTHTSILNIAEQVSPAQRVLVLGAAERTAKKHIRSDINQHVVNVAAVAAAENEVNALKEEAKRMADNA